MKGQVNTQRLAATKVLPSLTTTPLYGTGPEKRRRYTERLSLPPIPHSPKPPCSTTVLHFPAYTNAAPARKDIRSATRRNNPHPIGLAFQSSYNTHHQTFEIWNPDLNLFHRQYPMKIQHIGQTNFTSEKRLSQPSCHIHRELAPKLTYDSSSLYRCSFQPPRSSRDFDSSLTTTRFGCSRNSNPSVGIVPHVMTQQ